MRKLRLYPCMYTCSECVCLCVSGCDKPPVSKPPHVTHSPQMKILESAPYCITLTLPPGSNLSAKGTADKLLLPGIWVRNRHVWSVYKEIWVPAPMSGPPAGEFGHRISREFGRNSDLAPKFPNVAPKVPSRLTGLPEAGGIAPHNGSIKTAAVPAVPVLTKENF